jgi:hypothetical protein
MKLYNLSNNGKKEFHLYFSTNLGKISYENYLMYGNNNLGHKCITTHFSHMLSTNDIGR